MFEAALEQPFCFLCMEDSRLVVIVVPRSTIQNKIINQSLQNFCEQNHVALLQQSSYHIDLNNLMLMLTVPILNPKLGHMFHTE